VKQVKGILFILPKPAEASSVLIKNQLAYRFRKLVSSLLGYSQVPEKWVKVLAVNEDYANGLLWEAWNDNYKAINSLLREHDEIEVNMAKYNFSSDSEEMEKLIGQFEETSATLEACFREQDSLYQRIIGSSQTKQGVKIDRENLGWHRNGIIIDGKLELIQFPEELPAELFKGKAINDIITFTFKDIEFTFTLKEKLYGFDDSESCEDDMPENKFDGIMISEITKIKKKPSMPLPAKVALAALGGLGIIALMAACKRI